MTPEARTALQQRLKAMTDQEVSHAYHTQDCESEEADVIAEFARVRNVDL